MIGIGALCHLDCPLDMDIWCAKFAGFVDGIFTALFIASDASSCPVTLFLFRSKSALLLPPDGYVLDITFLSTTIIPIAHKTAYMIW